MLIAGDRSVSGSLMVRADDLLLAATVGIDLALIVRGGIYGSTACD